MQSNKDPKIAVIGSRSMVGSRFCELAGNSDLIKADLRGKIRVDLTDQKTIDNFFTSFDFDVIILFSAFTNVDVTEKQRNNQNAPAWKINVDGTKKIVSLCKSTGRKLIFISTDFVFDGKNGPYSENDPTPQDLSSVSWYGVTKIEGEKFIEDKLGNFLIIRIAYPYRGFFPDKDDFAKQILKKYDTHTLYPMFSDQIFTPTLVDDLNGAVSMLIKKNQTGIFHVASPKKTTPYEFAKEFLSVFGKDPTKLKQGSIKEFLRNNSNSTPRPINGGLKTEKIESLGFLPTSYIDGIKKIFDQSNGKLI